MDSTHRLLGSGFEPLLLNIFTFATITYRVSDPSNTPYPSLKALILSPSQDTNPELLHRRDNPILALNALETWLNLAQVCKAWRALALPKCHETLVLSRFKPAALKKLLFETDYPGLTKCVFLHCHEILDRLRYPDVQRISAFLQALEANRFQNLLSVEIYATEHQVAVIKEAFCTSALLQKLLRVRWRASNCERYLVHKSGVLVTSLEISCERLHAQSTSRCISLNMKHSPTKRICIYERSRLYQGLETFDQAVQFPLISINHPLNLSIILDRENRKTLPRLVNAVRPNPLEILEVYSDFEVPSCSRLASLHPLCPELKHLVFDLTAFSDPESISHFRNLQTVVIQIGNHQHWTTEENELGFRLPFDGELGNSDVEKLNMLFSPSTTFPRSLETIFIRGHAQVGAEVFSILPLIQLHCLARNITFRSDIQVLYPDQPNSPRRIVKHNASFWFTDNGEEDGRFERLLHWWKHLVVPSSSGELLIQC